ncbi:FAD/NAD(P)-binding protein [Aliivibrio fischeri]|uniref:FAD/NAD(P)-binding protein n=1 Tax=Aliivibrio fischeri TaxID=668 RepID=UPI0012DA27F0|nr:FAD/NAD(P)-binding protein [Aliivibrio fischeri]MUJ37775.1 hypothetical protein [Aliivibrio fischeri]
MTMKLVIAGGGISALSLLKTLSLASEMKTLISEVVVYAPYGLGYAPNFFNQPQSSLCNTSVGVMSLVHHLPDQYYNWLTNNGFLYEVSDFTPRSLYGRFLREEAFHIIKTFKSLGISLVIINEALASFECLDDKVQCFSQGGIRQCDYLVIATGHQDRVSPTNNYLFYPEHQEQIMTASFEEQRVLVLGSRLSSVDAILLLKNKPMSQVDVASRSANFPAVRKKLLGTEPKVLNADQILNDARCSGVSVYMQFIQAMNEEVDCYFDGTINITYEDPLKQLNLDIENVIKDNVGWEDTLDNIMSNLNSLWCYFSEGERSLFHEQYSDFIKRYLYAFPLKNAQQLKDTLEKFNSSIFAADSNHIYVDNHGQFLLNSSTYDYIIDATGCHKMPIFQQEGTYTINKPGCDDNITQTKFNVQGQNKVYVTGSIRTYLPVVNYVKEITHFNQELVLDLFKKIKNTCIV